jgi:hypothetical protein
MIVRTPCTVATFSTVTEIKLAISVVGEKFLSMMLTKMNVKLPPCVIKHNAVDAFGEGVEV